jgi:glycine/D-amino acid oxidase-like deaminating enzyme
MRVAVLGGGLQGCCVATALASAGVQVDLYERNDALLSEASLRNEGKLHLGYVYAHDPSLQTAQLMLRGAAAFAPLLRRWVGSDIDRIPISSPFHYVVHRDSLLSPDQIAHHLARCCAFARDETRGKADYFGVDFREPPAVAAGYRNDFDDRTVARVFATAEIAVDTEVLAATVRDGLARYPNIRCVLSAEVTRVSADDRQAGVFFSTAGSVFHQSYDHVVNATWESRLAIDATLGLEPPRPWLFRLKHYVRVRPPASMNGSIPSSTIVLGPFGDIVAYDGGELYLSWYPAAVARRSSDVRPPGWRRDLDGKPAMEMFAAVTRGLATIVPNVAALSADNVSRLSVTGGVIFAWGSSDIDDPTSMLHERAAIGPRRFGRYCSIDTGKLTMAPLFARMAADSILAA